LSATVTEELHNQDLSTKQIHLIRTTYRAISEKGSHRVSLQEIADRAGVSKGIILYHFKTKDRLMLQTMEWVLRLNAERIRKAIATETNPRQKVLAMIEEIFRSADANRRFYLTYLDLLDHAARVAEFGKLNATFRSIVNALYADVIQSGVSEGVFTVENVDEAAYTLRAIVDGLFLQWLQETNWKSLHRRYREICERSVLTYLRAAPAESP
jgi:TetR/AcrR family transcriptional regulator, fatty acid metabolism regulator protein